MSQRLLIICLIFESVRICYVCGEEWVRPGILMASIEILDRKAVSSTDATWKITKCECRWLFVEIVYVVNNFRPAAIWNHSTKENKMLGYRFIWHVIDADGCKYGHGKTKFDHIIDDSCVCLYMFSAFFRGVCMRVEIWPDCAFDHDFSLSAFQNFKCSQDRLVWNWNDQKSGKTYRHMEPYQNNSNNNCKRTHRFFLPDPRQDIVKLWLFAFYEN